MTDTDDPRLNVQSGPFKGKPQQWFTRKEVVRLMEDERKATLSLPPALIAAHERLREAVQSGEKLHAYLREKYGIH